jgi:hypothetical protein
MELCKTKFGDTTMKFLFTTVLDGMLDNIKINEGAEDFSDWAEPCAASPFEIYSENFKGESSDEEEKDAYIFVNKIINKEMSVDDALREFYEKHLGYVPANDSGAVLV